MQRREALNILAVAGAADYEANRSYADEEAAARIVTRN